MQQANAVETYYFHSRRDRVETSFFELYRCFKTEHKLCFSAHATRFGKPVQIYGHAGDTQAVAEIRNRKGYLVNGRTDIYDKQEGCLIGSYTRFGRVRDADDNKTGTWRDARSWGEEFKVNLIDAIGNTLLGSGDVPGGVNSSDTHLLSSGKTILAVLQREKLPFFPDPPKRTQPSKFARLASKVVPGELGKSLAEITPPYGWKLTINSQPDDERARKLLLYASLTRIEFLRWSRSS
jgi:hypothetical protein